MSSLRRRGQILGGVAYRRLPLLRWWQIAVVRLNSDPPMYDLYGVYRHTPYAVYKACCICIIVGVCDGMLRVRLIQRKVLDGGLVYFSYWLIKVTLSHCICVKCHVIGQHSSKLIDSLLRLSTLSWPFNIFLSLFFTSSMLVSHLYALLLPVSSSSYNRSDNSYCEHCAHHEKYSRWSTAIEDYDW